MEQGEPRVLEDGWVAGETNVRVPLNLLNLYRGLVIVVNVNDPLNNRNEV